MSQKDCDFEFGSMSEPMVMILGSQSFISFIDPILGHPLYQFLQKTELSDFTVSAYHKDSHGVTEIC